MVVAAPQVDVEPAQVIPVSRLAQDLLGATGQGLRLAKLSHGEKGADAADQDPPQETPLPSRFREAGGFLVGRARGLELAAVDVGFGARSPGHRFGPRGLSSRPARRMSAVSPASAPWSLRPLGHGRLLVGWNEGGRRRGGRRVADRIGEGWRCDREGRWPRHMWAPIDGPPAASRGCSLRASLPCGSGSSIAIVNPLQPAFPGCERGRSWMRSSPSRMSR